MKKSLFKAMAGAALLSAAFAFMVSCSSSSGSDDSIDDTPETVDPSGQGGANPDGTGGTGSGGSGTGSGSDNGSGKTNSIPDNQVTPGGTAATGVMGTPTAADVSNATVEIVKSEGWLNSAYIIFNQVEGATYKVLCDDVEIDAPLIRYYDTYTYYENTDNDGQTVWAKKTLTKVVRADALGLAAGNHTMKVCAVGTENTSDYSTASMTVAGHDRSGFAFAPSAKTTPGAYKADGTLKDNAIVLYVTAGTAKTVSYAQEKGKNASANATYTGLQSVLSESSLKKLTVPLCIRIVGTIKKADVDSLGSSAEGLQIKTTSENGVTIEGVGHDAGVYGFGFLIREAKYVELANLGVYNFMDDGISVDTNNSYLWIHNNDISYGAVGSDSDQAKGDGSLDFKKSTYSSLCYNHFWDSGKCNLLDASAGSGSNYLTYHHNWYDHSDSRHPRIRNASAVHVYNNYYDGNAKYGVGVTTGSSAFVEGNYFRNANDPMMSSKQGTDARGSGTFSGENGGVIKAWDNFYTGNSNYASEGGTVNAAGMKLQYITNKWDYTNGTELGEYREWTETIGTDNGDGTWTIYDSKVTDTTDTIATNSLISIEDAAKKGAYYQGSKGKTMFYLDVPANTTKIVIKAKTGSSDSGATSTLKVGSVTSGTIGNTSYSEYEFAISGLSSETTLAVTNGSSKNSLNISEIKLIAASGWETVLTSGADLSNIDAYEVDSRDEQVPANVLTKAGNTQYSNFDVALGDSGMGVSIAVTGPVQAKADVMKYSGRHNPDFAYQFDNAADDKDYGVNTTLKNLVVNYTSGMTAVQGTAASGTSGSGESGTTGGESGESGGSESGGTSGGESGSTGGESGGTTTMPEGTVVVTFDSFTSGATVNGVTVSGNLKSGIAEKVYNGTTYKTALKMESKTSIAFATTEAKTLTIITDSSSKNIKIDDKSVATDSDGVVTQSLAAGSHTIAKGDTINVYAIIIAPTE